MVKTEKEEWFYHVGRKDMSKDKELEFVYQIFCQEWEILKRHYKRQDWGQLVKDLEHFAEGFNYSPRHKAMAVNMAMGVYAFLRISETDREEYKKG